MSTECLLYWYLDSLGDRAHPRKLEHGFRMSRAGIPDTYITLRV